MNIPSNFFEELEEIYKILINIDPSKAYGIDKIPGRFLKDEAELLIEPLRKIINLPLSSKFPLIKIQKPETLGLFYYCQYYQRL